MDRALALVAYFLVAAAMIGALVAAAWVLRVKARRDSPLKALTYESGESPEGLAWVRFHARYYLVALFFVLFDVEAALLFPWASAVRTLGPQGFFGATAFIVVLMLGWAWALRKGAFRWQ